MAAGHVSENDLFVSVVCFPLRWLAPVTNTFSVMNHYYNS